MPASSQYIAKPLFVTVRERCQIGALSLLQRGQGPGGPLLLGHGAREGSLPRLPDNRQDPGSN